MIKYAWQKKYEKIWLTVFFDNLGGIKLYKKCGFEVEGIFLDDEKLFGLKRNVVSMAIFKNSRNSVRKRNNIMKKLMI
jgi:RimJ/RimL family protein N-acetyltransferase